MKTPVQGQECLEERWSTLHDPDAAGARVRIAMEDH